MKKIALFIVACILLLNITACSGEKKTTEKESRSDISENYIESEIILPESIYTVTSISAETPEQIRIAGYDENENNNAVWEWDGEVWEQIFNLQEFIKQEEAVVDKTGNFNISISESDEILVLCREDTKTKMLIVDGEFNISLNPYIDEMLTQYSISSLKQIEKNLYLLTDGMGKIYVLDSEKEAITAVNAENEYTYVYKYADGYLYLLTTEELRIIDCETMEEINDDEVKSWINDFLTDFSDFKINFAINKSADAAQCYIATSDGITKLAYTEQTLLVDGTRSALGNNSLFIDFLSVYDESMVVLMAADDKSKIYTYEYKDDVAKIENETLIYTLEENQSLSQAVNLYNRQNPTAKIIIEIGMSDESITMSDALKQLNIELETGNGPDIIILDGMDIDAYIDKGVLLDISDVVTKSKDSGEVLNNIVDTYEMDGKIYAVPTKFLAMYAASKNDDIVGNSQDIETLYRRIISLSEDGEHEDIIDSWSFNQVVSVLYRGMLAKDNEKLTKDQISTFYEIVLGTYEMIDLEEVLDKIGRKLEKIEARPTSYHDFELAAIDSVAVALDYIDSLSGLQVIEILQDAGLCSYSFLGSDGENYYLPAMVAGISAKSDNQETAQDFIAFLLGEEVQSDYDAEGLPVNISGIKNKMAKLEENNYTISPESGHGHKDNADAEKITIQLQQFTEQKRADIIEEMKQFKAAVKDDSYIRTIILTEADKIIFDGADQDSAVETVMNNIKIYEDE